MNRKPTKLAIIGPLYPLYTLFSIKIKNFFKKFSKVVTIGTKARIVIYQHLFAQICIFCQDTIGYKRYNCYKKLAIPTI
jgi:hypothetical protein